MTICTPLDVAHDGRDAMIAIGMNGGPLPREHGFPARMVVPGLYGFVSACKWITRMTLTTYDAEQAYWTERDWATDAPIKISSRIDTPKPLSRPDAGTTVIGGIAWAQQTSASTRSRSASTVAPGSPPSSAPGQRRLLAPVVPRRWDAEPGRHLIASRATNRTATCRPTPGCDPSPRARAASRRSRPVA